MPSKFAGLVSQLREPEPAKPAPKKPPPTSKPRQESTKQIGRPRTGKKSNPHFEASLVYLDKEQKYEAIEQLRLMNMDMGKYTTDFSDLLNQLLADWLKGKRLTQ